MPWICGRIVTPGGIIVSVQCSCCMRSPLWPLIGCSDTMYCVLATVISVEKSSSICQKSWAKYGLKPICPILLCTMWSSILVLDGLLSADPYCIMPRWMYVAGPCTGNDTWDGYQWSREPVVSILYLVDDSLTAHQIFLPGVSLSKSRGRLQVSQVHCSDNTL